MKTLFVLYDGKCSMCRSVRAWLERQAAFVPLSFLPLQSSELGRRFPGIEAFHPEQELVIVSDEGELWQGGAAWIMCLWALKDYREWAMRLATPVLLPFARRVCVAISENRHALSRWFGRANADELEERLAAIPEACANTGYCRPL